MKSSSSAALLLVFLSITTAELLTGSTPLYALLSPLTLPLLVGLYGCGVLLVRWSLTPVQMFCLASGGVGFLIGVDFLTLAVYSGALFVAVVYLVWITLFYRRLRRSPAMLN